MLEYIQNNRLVFFVGGGGGGGVVLSPDLYLLLSRGVLQRILW